MLVRVLCKKHVNFLLAIFLFCYFLINSENGFKISYYELNYYPRTFNFLAKFYQPDSTPRIDYESCMEKEFSVRNTTHPGAPINSMPRGNELLSNFSRNISICDTSKTNLRLLMILSRLDSFQQRQAIRETYASYDQLSNISLSGNWSYFFIVAKPSTETEQAKIESEMESFRDIVSINNSDGYYQLTNKVLIGLKVASCYCPNADYVIKTDDDTYIRIPKLDYVISKQQDIVDRESFEAEAKGEQDFIPRLASNKNHVPFYSGKNCEEMPVVRWKGKWEVCFNFFKSDTLSSKYRI